MGTQTGPWTALNFDVFHVFLFFFFFFWLGLVWFYASL